MLTIFDVDVEKIGDSCDECGGNLSEVCDKETVLFYCCEHCDDIENLLKHFGD